MKQRIITNSVAALKEFGYPQVNEENIFTDEVYSAFFEKMLKDAKDTLLEKGEDVSVIEELISEIIN
jgi:uncharacterized Zn ribbon protein